MTVTLHRQRPLEKAPTLPTAAEAFPRVCLSNRSGSNESRPLINNT